MLFVTLQEKTLTMFENCFKIKKKHVSNPMCLPDTGNTIFQRSIPIPIPKFGWGQYQYQYQYSHPPKGQYQYQYQYLHLAWGQYQYQYQYSDFPQSQYQYQYQYWPKVQYLNTNTNTFDLNFCLWHSKTLRFTHFSFNLFKCTHIFHLF